MWFWIIVALILSLVGVGLWAYVIVDMKRMNTRINHMLGEINNIEASLEEYYEKTLMPMEKYYYDNVSDS